jgi:hypothetical protein
MSSMTFTLILKRAKFSRSSGQWQDEDFDLLADGKVVGRILESGSPFDPPDLRWTWSITSIWPATRRVGKPDLWQGQRTTRGICAAARS